MDRIRPAVAADAAELARLAERTFRETFAEGNDPGAMDVHCERSFGEAVQAAEIQRLYVDAPWQGRGVARRLMDALLDAASQGNADAAWLGVWERNPRAIAFYEKCGFGAVGHHVFMPGSDPQRDLVFAMALQESPAP